MKQIKSNLNEQKTGSLLMLATCLLMVSEAAFCQTTAPWEGVLQTVVDFLTGTSGTLLGIIAVALLGISMMFGLIDIRKFAFTAIGIGILFGAANIVELFKGA